MRKNQRPELPEPTNPERIPIRLPAPPKRGARAFVTLLFCGALFVAAFGLGLLLQAKDKIPAFLSDWLTQKEPSADTPTDAPKQETPEETEKNDESQQDEEGEQTVGEAPEALPEGAIPIKAQDLAGQGEELQNLSIYPIDPNALTLPAPEAASGNDPLVLILCTHSSECYTDGKSVKQPIGDAIYSTDPEVGVLAVGKALAASLSEKGVPALFCNVRHDEPTLRGSYARAKESIETLLERYPGIRYVIDLHRDGILSGDGSLIAASVEWEGQSFAQILPVVGSDGDGSDVYLWQENLALARELEKRLGALCPRICRPVSLRNSPYNQNIATHSLLIEVGAAGNTVDEALRSAELLAKALAAYLKGE